MKHGLVTLVVILILKDTETFQVLFTVSLICAWNFTTEKIIKSDVHLKVKSAKCLCSHPVVLAWSCYFGHGLGLKNLVLFTSLTVYLLYIQFSLSHHGIVIIILR